MEGAIWEAAVTTDGLQAPDYGLLLGGAIQNKYPYFTWRAATASPVSDPG
jgi:hypothetical protein